MCGILGCGLDKRKGNRVTNIIWVHPLVCMKVHSRFHGNLASHFLDIPFGRKVGRRWTDITAHRVVMSNPLHKERAMETEIYSNSERRLMKNSKRDLERMRHRDTTLQRVENKTKKREHPMPPSKIKKASNIKCQKNKKEKRVKYPQRSVRMCGSYRSHKPKYSGNWNANLNENLCRPENINVKENSNFN